MIDEEGLRELEDDLVKALERMNSLEFAELDHRIADPVEHAIAIQEARARVMRIQKEYDNALTYLEGGEYDDG